jgi:uncharacterized membrane protein (UPF0127 family)
MVLCAVGVLTALAVYLFLLPMARERLIEPTTYLRIGNTPVQIAEADTPQDRDRGLSGTTRLNKGTGMWFVFDRDDQHSFWMHDMNYAIDIIWVSRDLRVVHIEHSVEPDTFPDAFTPPTPARYVLEVESGFATEHGIEVGSKVTF